MIRILDPCSLEDYRLFVAIKNLPSYRVTGREVWFPDEYAGRLGIRSARSRRSKYRAPEWMFDYQRAITEIALSKQKYSVFADCGLGKTAILLEFARVAQKRTKKQVLIVSPLNVVSQTLAEAKRFFDFRIEQVTSSDLNDWLSGGSGIAITNYEAMKDIKQHEPLGGLLLDESSMLKSHYGKWASACLDLGKGVAYKLACTGTPAPNDRIEYANHAVFMDRFPTVNSFLATFFINRGQTQNRWELKPHALKAFYIALSDWCIFLSNPQTYGWRDNCENIPPIITHIHHVESTTEQREAIRKLTGQLFVSDIGGIGDRIRLSQIGKGQLNGKKISTNKTAYIRSLIDSWPEESAIIWCLYNEEQAAIWDAFPDAVNIDGNTSLSTRMQGIKEFQSRQRRVLISKPRILGFGLNLQVATRQVFSGLQDSYESYYQAVKRSNRYGSTRPLNVHIPVTDAEEPMVQNVLRKADRVQQDTEEQERLFASITKQAESGVRNIAINTAPKNQWA